MLTIDDLIMAGELSQDDLALPNREKEARRRYLETLREIAPRKRMASAPASHAKSDFENPVLAMQKSTKAKAFHLVSSIGKSIGGRNTPWELWQFILTDRERCQLTAGAGKGQDPFCYVLKTHQTANRIWRAIHGGSYMRANLEIARRREMINDGELEWLLRVVGELPADDPDYIEEAIRTHKIALIDERRELYVDGKLQNKGASWTEKQWRFLWELGTNSLRGESFRACDFYIQLPKSDHAFANFKGRVVNKLAPGLEQYVGATPNEGYHLTVDVEKDLILQTASRENRRTF